ncbi:hypothetical protein JCM1840_002840 [Sporobolomyces johnsonii]
MAEALPLFLSTSSDQLPPAATHQPRSDSPSRLSFPVSVHSLAFHDGASRRDSVRQPPPPLPPKPNFAAAGGVGMLRSRSADEPARAQQGLAAIREGTAGWAAGANTTRDEDESGDSEDGTNGWMHALRGGATGGSPPPDDEDDDDDSERRSGGARTPASARSGATTPLHIPSPRTHSLAFSSHLNELPKLPVRPVKLSTPALSRVVPPPTDPSLLVDPPVSPSSCPPVMSPFAAMHSHHATGPALPPRVHSRGPSPSPDPFSRSPERTRFRPPPQPSVSSTLTTSSSAASILSVASSTTSASTHFGSGALSVLNRGLQQAKLKDRLVAGVGFTREWGGKGKGKLQDGWKGFHSGRATGSSTASTSSSWDSSASSSISNGIGGTAANSLGTSTSASTLQNYSLSSSASSPQLDSHYSSPFPPSSSSAPSSAAIKLPATILGIRVPAVRAIAFGLPLAPLVDSTRITTPSLLHRPKSFDPVTGDLALFWLPGVAYRCLQYLEEWGPKEEGIYRVPGRSNMVQQLRVLFDAGVGQELDLREVHAGDLDPNAVASLFKSWLRELPEPLLSYQLEAPIDILTQSALGYTASSTHFLGSNPNPNPGAAPSPSRGSPGLVDGRAPREYLEQLSDLFAGAMPAENYHLLRAIAYHLARLASHSATNKMTLTNLRLILSPTLRLSPGFLQVLVEEREILFGKANESARLRQASSSSLASPPLPSPTFSTASAHGFPHRRSPTPRSSPLLNPPSSPLASSSPTLPHSASATSAGSWLIVDEPSSLPSPPLPVEFDDERLSPVPSPTLPSAAQSSRGSPQTPIADRFASTITGTGFDPSTSRSRTLSASSSASAARTLPAPTPALPPFIPSRDRANGAGGGGFFGSARDPSPAPRLRKGSAVSLRSASASASGGGGGEGGATGVGQKKGSVGGGAAANEAREEAKTALGLDEDLCRAMEELASASASASEAPAARPSVDSTSTRSRSSSTTSPSRQSHESSLDVHSAQVQRAARLASPVKVQVPTTDADTAAQQNRITSLDLTLPMPSGLGILGAGGLQGRRREGGKDEGEGEGEGDDEAGWGGLLSVEERRKFFGGA